MATETKTEAKRKPPLLVPAAAAAAGILILGGTWLFTAKPWEGEPAPEPTSSVAPVEGEEEETPAAFDPAHSDEFDLFDFSAGTDITFDELPEEVRSATLTDGFERAISLPMDVGTVYSVELKTDGFSARSTSAKLLLDAGFDQTNDLTGDSSSAFVFTNGAWYVQIVYDHTGNTVEYTWAPIPEHAHDEDAGHDFH